MKSSKSNRNSPKRGGERKVLNRLVENKHIHNLSYEDYRSKVNKVYSGPQGAFLSTASMLSLHIPLGNRMFRKRKFNLQGMKSILDIGSGAGQIVTNLLRYSDEDAEIVCADLSHQMLCRARTRLKSTRPCFVSADLAALPFADASFDGITCGYVLEHLPEPEPGLRELSRVLRPGGRMFLLTTEDSFFGAFNSRLWCCRTYNRRELKKLCESMNLTWKRELWFTKVHQVMRAGGICVEIQKASD